MGKENVVMSILVVEDDVAYSKAISDVLTKAGYSVDMTSDGRKAASMVGIKDYALILSDIRMPELNGVQFLHGVRKVKPSIPIVLMTGFSNEATREEAIGMGAAAFLMKPFNSKALLDTVNGILRPKIDGEKSDAGADEFCEISIDEFISGKKVDLDLYVKLGEGKFVKVAHAGDDLPPDRLAAYRAHQLEFLYVKKADYEKYVLLQLKLVNAVTKNSQIPEAKKVSFLRHANEVIMEQLLLSGVDKKSFMYAKNITEANLAILSKSDVLFPLIDSLNQASDHLYAHSLGVSIYSSMLARAVGWTAATTLYKISLGGMLHDIGLKSLSPELLQKPRRSYSNEELKVYEKHPLVGVDMLQGIEDIPTEVLLIVSQHHENRAGTGFPAALRDSAIFPMAKLVAVVDEFCELTVKSPGVTPKAPLEALKFIFSFKGSYLEKNFLESFMKLFGVEDVEKNARVIK